MRLLITGGLGFIGSHMVQAALDAGHDVRVFDIRALAQASREPDCGDLAVIMSNVELVQGDVRDRHALRPALANIDAVLHLAAKVGLGDGVSDAADYVSNNDLGTAELVAAIAETEIARVVLASSMVVYGGGLASCPTHGPIAPAPRAEADLARGLFEAPCPVCATDLRPLQISEDCPLSPTNVYAATKLSQEHLVAAWARARHGSATALRFHNVYGRRLPRDTPYAGVAALFVSMLRNGTAPQVFEDGEQLRDFVHVRDVARACLAALSADNPGESVAYNVGSGVPRSVLEMAAALSNASGGTSPQVTGQYRLGDVRHITASSQHIANSLGWRATEDFLAGMAELNAVRPGLAVGSA